jgi:DNA-binding NtrC family response regulator
MRLESILIVDDDVNLCRALSEELNEVGYDTTFVNDAESLFKQIYDGKEIDLILLDLKMPVRDGFYVLSRMQKENIKKKIIVLTAYSDLKSAMDSAKLGASDFISKPYDLDELIITIRKVLQQD